jgi:hypothetical protein
LDGILIANELVDDAKRNKKEMFLFKVVFEKAYDLVNWSYLEVVMAKMDFSVKWRKWVIECVSAATTLLLVNGGLTEEFHLGRRLKRGDPLSLFLFLLVAERYRWLEGDTMSISFNRLFELTIIKNITVADMYRRG